MVGFEMIQTIGDATATYKFTPKYVLKAGQKVTVRVESFMAGCPDLLVHLRHPECSFTPDVPAGCLLCCFLSTNTMIPKHGASESSLTVLLSDLGFRCWCELQTSHRPGLEESFLLDVWRGCSRGADQPSGRGRERSFFACFSALVSSDHPFVSRPASHLCLPACVQEVAKRSTTYKATEEQNDEDDDGEDEASEENVFQQVRRPLPRPFFSFINIPLVSSGPPLTDLWDYWGLWRGELSSHYHNTLHSPHMSADVCASLLLF